MLLIEVSKNNLQKEKRNHSIKNKRAPNSVNKHRIKGHGMMLVLSHQL